MLRELSIRNFAIIDDLKIRFSEGLTILSGETGAGKSIIINAVNLLLGSRASPQLIRTGAESAELEAFFEIQPGGNAARAMEACGYDGSEGLLIRRIISRNEKSRIYINGRLSTMAVLNNITENIASISAQHAHQGLLKEENHLFILDQFGRLIRLREDLNACYNEILPLVRKLKELNDLQSRRFEQTELYRFQKKEIEQAAITPGEDAILEQEKIRLRNAATLYQIVTSSIDSIYDSQGAIIEKLSVAKRDLEKAGEFDPALGLLARELSEVSYHLEDITEKLRAYLNTLELDEGRLEAIEERMDLLNRLKRKYGGSLEAVLDHLSRIHKELSGIETIPEQIADTEKQLKQLHKRLVQLATELSHKRKDTAQTFAKKVEKELTTLRMPKTKFSVSLDTLQPSDSADPYLSLDGKTISDTGFDRAAFMIAPNVGESLKPLASIVSGGELSRVILALKAILAETESVETIVFDEVDAGIGGSVAEVVGRKLLSLSKYHQVLCITHLPQIAKFADHHFRISKHVLKGRTHTTITPLRDEERVEEIARMLGGIHITEKTLSHAQELLENR
ncbi:MAG: DNA repair protein RecN [Deltaproteobacteria bacterium]|nr:DNA repair protein RecN [Deltaproteobacteria bacterium]